MKKISYQSRRIFFLLQIVKNLLFKMVSIVYKNNTISFSPPLSDPLPLRWNNVYLNLSGKKIRHSATKPRPPLTFYFNAAPASSDSFLTRSPL